MYLCVHVCGCVALTGVAVNVIPSAIGLFSSRYAMAVSVDDRRHGRKCLWN